MILKREDLPYYTVEDYKSWEGDWELIEGIPYAMAPSPLGIHQKIISNLIYEFRKELENCPDRCFVYAELDWVISEDTVLRPDLSLVCKEIKEYIKETPFLVVEVVSKSTAKKDEILKFKIYEREKAPYYILVYPEIQKVRVFKLEGNTYEKYFDADSGFLSIPINDSCSINISVEKIFQ